MRSQYIIRSTRLRNLATVNREFTEAATGRGDFDCEMRSLQVQRQYKRQGQQNQTEIISLTLDIANALQDWLNLIYIPDEFENNQTALFISLDRANYGHRLTGTAIYGLVRRAAINGGISDAIAVILMVICDRKHEEQTV